MNPEVFSTLLGMATAGCLTTVLTTLGYMIAGPNPLGRLVSLESMIAMLQGMLAASMAWSLDTSVVYPMLTIALLGFLSSLTVVKFRVPNDGKTPAKSVRKGVSKTTSKVIPKKTAQRAAPKATSTTAPKTVKRESK